MPENTSCSNIMTAIICSDDQTIEYCRSLISLKPKESFKILCNMIQDGFNKKVDSKKIKTAIEEKEVV